MMKQFVITISSEDTQCVITAENEEEAVDKYWQDEIDEWLTEKSYQPDVTAEPYSGD